MEFIFKQSLKMSMMNQTDYDYVFKILLIGDSGVGKSSLLMRFADDIFTDNFLPTIGVDFKIRTIQSAGSVVKLQLWDTAGQQKFKTIVSAYYKGAHGIILVYDITDRLSFRNLQTWLEESEKYSKEDVVRILVGNKKDLERERQVKQSQAKSYAESMGMIYLETSAKDKVNIEEAFTSLVIQMKKQVPKLQPRIINAPLDLQKIKDKKTKSTTCC